LRISKRTQAKKWQPCQMRGVHSGWGDEPAGFLGWAGFMASVGPQVEGAPLHSVAGNSTLRGVGRLALDT